MILESIYIAIPCVVLFLILICPMFIRHRRNKKRKALLENNNFVDLYFEQYPNEKEVEYTPCKNRPINKLKEEIFFGQNFCIFVDKYSIRKLDYKDIYWVYGETLRQKENQTKLKTNPTNAVVIKSIYKTYRIYVKKQETIVKYFYDLNILAGYSAKARALAPQRKKLVKKRNKK